MTDTPPKQSGTGSGNNDLPASRPSGRTLLKVVLVLAALFAIPVLVLVIAWSTGR
jgi:preprotein translocase subunit SecG